MPPSPTDVRFGEYFRSTRRVWRGTISRRKRKGTRPANRNGCRNRHEDELLRKKYRIFTFRISFCDKIDVYTQYNILLCALIRWFFFFSLLFTGPNRDTHTRSRVLLSTFTNKSWTFLFLPTYRSLMFCFQI